MVISSWGYSNSYIDGRKFMVEFLDQNGAVTKSITNWTSLNVERDYFTPSDAFTLVLEDDREMELQAELQAGMAVKLSIDTHPIMIGYILKYNIKYSKNVYTLTISGKDLLGYMGQAVCYPNLGHPGSTTNFHFNVNDTIQTALQTIFNAFTSSVLIPNISVEVEDGAYLTFATGFATGVKRKGKTGRGISHSLNKAMGHLTAPNKGETYLAYALRLAKHIGANIKLAPGRQDVVIVSPPTYDRTNTSPFKLYHYKTKPNNLMNNILSGEMDIDIDGQPSVIIAELATQGSNTYYQSTLKAVVINELTGYPRGINSTGTNGALGPLTFNFSGANALVSGSILSLSEAIPSVQLAINSLTNGQQITIDNNSDGYAKTGYILLNPNDDVYNELPRTVIAMQTQISCPSYFIDQNAQTLGELRFGAAKAMAEKQEKYFTLKYSVEGWVQNGAIWYPNMMCYVRDEITSPAYPIDGMFWIRKVNYIKSKDTYICNLELSLPYISEFDLSPGSINETPANTASTDIWKQ